MPIDYVSILQRAYRLTLQQPGLWLLGLFLAGGFNGNFLYLAQLQIGWRDKAGLFRHSMQVSDEFITAGVLGIVLTIGIMILANWFKILFVLQSSGLLKLTPQADRVGDTSVIKRSKPFLVPVILVSMVTMLSIAIITAVLFGTPALVRAHTGFQPVLWLIAFLAFIGLVLFFSCLNVFATFFIVLYNFGPRRGLNLAIDLIVSRWQPVLTMALLLIIIYAGCFFVGASLVFLLKYMTAGLLLPLASFGLGSPAMLGTFVTLLSGILLWVWLAIVNVFFNLSLLLLFAQLVQPPLDPEFVAARKIPVAVPGAS